MLLRKPALVLALALAPMPGTAQTSESARGTTPPAALFSLDFAASPEEFGAKLNLAAADGYRVVDGCATDTACRRLRYKQLSVYLEKSKAPAKSEYRLVTALDARQLDAAAADGFRLVLGASTFITETEPFSLFKLLQAFHREPWMNSGRATYTVPVLVLEQAAAGPAVEYHWIKSHPKNKSGRPRLDMVLNDIQPVLDKGERLVWMNNDGFEALLEGPAGPQNASGKAAAMHRLLLAGARSEMPILIADAGARGYRLAHIYGTSHGILRRYFAYMEPAEGPHEYRFLKSELNANPAFQQALAEGFRLVRSATLPKTVSLEKAPGESRKYEYLVMAASKKAELEQCVNRARGEGFRPVHMPVNPKILPNSCGSDPNRGREWGVLMER